MPSDRITQLAIDGMRCVESISVQLHDLNVLVGENGTGKSTIIEGLELLRKAATESPLLAKVYQHHDGTRLVRNDASHLRLGVTIEGNGPALSYSIRIVRDGAYLTIAEETVEALSRGPGHGFLMRRVLGDFWYGDIPGKQSTSAPDETVITHARFLKDPQLVRVQQALAAIEVHTALDLRRTWSHTASSQTARTSNVARPVDRLDPGGTNLVNVYAALKNQRDWRETLGRLQVALGDIDDVLLVSEVSGGTQAIVIRWSSGLEIPLSGLSDGQISVLALVAIQQLKRATPPSLVVIDEPEIHLHPGLIARVAVGLQDMAEEVPVLVGTQSDAFLNAIERAEDAVVLCQLDEQRRTVLLRPDRDRLRVWLTEFAGLGAMRNAGLQDVAFPASS